MKKNSNFEKKIDKSLDYLEKHTFKDERWLFVDDDHIQNNSILVSNYGRVFNTITCMFLKEYGYDNTKPYCYLNLVGEQTYTVAVEDLVTACFLKKPQSDERLVLDHLDGDITNNNVRNLKWRTLGEMKGLRAEMKDADYTIKVLKQQMANADNACERWREGYWNLYFKYVPEDKRNKNITEDGWKKGYISPSDMFLYITRDYAAEGVEYPKENNLIDFTMDYDDPYEHYEEREQERLENPDE